MTIKNLHRDYYEDMMCFYSNKGVKVKRSHTRSSNVRLREPIDAMVVFYKNEMTTTRAWTTESEFKAKLKEAKRKFR